MPDYPQAETDVHASLTAPPKAMGSGTYQTGTAPMSVGQRVKEAQTSLRAKAMESTKQKVKSYAPGSDPAVQAKIKAAGSGPVSFSDQD